MKPKNLTEPMLRMLRAARDHDNPFHGLRGRSEEGGAHGTWVALIRRGLLTMTGRLTPEGRKVVDPQ